MKSQGCSLHWLPFITVILLCAPYQGLPGKVVEEEWEGGGGKGADGKDGEMSN